MTYVVTEPCVGTKDRSCVEVCPVDCFYNHPAGDLNQKVGKEAPKAGDIGMLVIHPDECIHCGACEPECPVEAIYEDTGVPDEMKEFVKLNEEETSAMSDDELDSSRCTSKTA